MGQGQSEAALLASPLQPLSVVQKSGCRIGFRFWRIPAPPTSPVLEITAKPLMQDGPETLATLRELEAMECASRLDDFGNRLLVPCYRTVTRLQYHSRSTKLINQGRSERASSRAISRAIIGQGRRLCAWTFTPEHRNPGAR